MRGRLIDEIRSSDMNPQRRGHQKTKLLGPVLLGEEIQQPVVERIREWQKCKLVEPSQNAL